MIKLLKKTIRRSISLATTPWRRTRFALKCAHTREVGDKDLIICSPGGVATTTLLTYLSTQMVTNSPADLDNLKHVSRPDLLFGDSMFRGRVIYIYGSPDMVVGSIERRGWIRIQAAKLGCISTAFLPLSWARSRFHRAVQEQIEAFTTSRNDRLMCVEFDDLWRRVGDIASFLDLEEQSFAQGFPPRRARTVPLDAAVNA